MNEAQYQQTLRNRLRPGPTPLFSRAAEKNLLRAVARRSRDLAAINELWPEAAGAAASQARLEGLAADVLIVRVSSPLAQRALQRRQDVVLRLLRSVAPRLRAIRWLAGDEASDRTQERP